MRHVQSVLTQPQEPGEPAPGGQASELWRRQGCTFSMLPGFSVIENAHLVAIDLDWHVGLVVGVVVLRRGLGTCRLVPVGGDL